MPDLVVPKFAEAVYRYAVALITVLVSAGVGVVASIVTGYVTAHLTARQEVRRWRTELAGKYAELVTDRPAQAQALARQFAIGVFVLETGRTEGREKFFIAPHTRMTAGRAEENEIVLPTALASRRHFSVSAGDKYVYVEDLGSANGFAVNGQRVIGPRILKSGDIIQFGNDCHIEFQPLPSRE
jgi:hypothetical protein